MSEIKLSALSNASLSQLHAKKVQAEREYNIALNSTLAAMGLDPREQNTVNLDTGVVTPATKDTPA